MLRVWTKKLGQKHYTRDGATKTLCGMPMLGNNYADGIPESEQKECEECCKVLEKENEEFQENDENADIKKLEKIRSKMLELLEEAEYIVRITGSRHIYDRAKAYWIPHIKTALSNDTEYLGKSMVTMQDTISEIESQNNTEDTEDLD